MNAYQQTSFKLKPPLAPGTHVLCTGPESATNRDGDEIPVWFVGLVTPDRETAGRVYKVYDYWKARLLAASMADDRHLPHEQEASRAYRPPCAHQQLHVHPRRRVALSQTNQARQCSLNIQFLPLHIHLSKGNTADNPLRNNSCQQDARHPHLTKTPIKASPLTLS